MNAPKGTKDVLPEESYKWHYIETHMRKICDNFGYREIRTPVFEHTELFLRGVGDTTDIVQKEMYTFLDKGGRSVTLKPEGTAGAARSFVESAMYSQPLPAKMYYLNNPLFRYEKPQAGRLREHHQFGIEVFGAQDASADAEVISVALELYRRLGITELALNLNSIGCPKCRPSYYGKLKNYLTQNLEHLCQTCKDRFEKNPLRILDCKEENCKRYVKDAPVMIESLCDECSAHFDDLQRCLNALNVQFSINPFIVRGLDYYTKTVFELISTQIGSQGTVCGGGRYDGLIEQVGGPPIPGVGFGMGMERLLLVMEQAGISIPEPSVCDIFFCTYGQEAKIQAFELADRLRQRNIKADIDHCARSLKAQFKFANKLGCRYVAVMGSDELARNCLKLKDMQDGQEEEIDFNIVIDKIVDLLSE